MARTEVTSIDEVAAGGTDAHATAAIGYTASAGTLCTGANGGYVPDYDPSRDTVTVYTGGSAATITFSVNSANPAGRTNDLAISASANASVILPPGALDSETFSQSGANLGELWVDTTDNMYVTVTRGPRP